ncbi:MAG: ribokinase [Phycisphaeraceae bacterium]|nr:MAG: ribokinase [Phycisphaeraceae bacterium]
MSNGVNSGSASTPRVCVVGSVNMDLVVRAPKIPAPGETVMGRSFENFPGGKGANQAVAAARLGATVMLLGAVGSEAHGQQLAQTLHREGVDVSRMVRREDLPTGVALITVDDHGENTIVVAPGANATLTAAYIEENRDVIETCDVLLAQLEVPLDAVAAAAKIAREAGKPVILNAAPASPAARELVKLSDLLIVNRGEAALLGGMDPFVEPGRLALRLAEIGPPAIVLTLGSQGSILAYRGRPRRIPTLSVKAVDAVGAGDAFAGVLAVGWAAVHPAIKSKDPEEFRLVERALASASVAGALATRTRGAIPSLPSHDEVIARVPELEKLLRV